MGHLDSIEKAAQKLIALCEKEKQTATDKKRMLQIHAELLTSIENLTECETCGAITEMIATVTLADVTAKLCKECGIKSLESGKIQTSKAGTTRKRTRRTTKPKSSKAAPQTAQADTPETPAALHTRVETETGIKKTDVKRLHKIVQGIAAPMNAEHTFEYVQREAEIAKIKVDPSALEKAVTLLTP